MVDQHAIECIDRVLAQCQRHRRVDISEMPDNAFKALAIQCEQRAKKVVTLVNNRIETGKRSEIHARSMP